MHHDDLHRMDKFHVSQWVVDKNRMAIFRGFIEGTPAIVSDHTTASV